MSDIDFARSVVDMALAAGATQCEATTVVAERFRAEARGGELEKLEQSVGKSLIVRAFVDGAKASLTTSDLSADGVRALVRETVAAARFVTADPLGGLPEYVAYDDANDAGLGLYASDVRERTVEDKIDAALALERAIRSVDPRIVNSAGSTVTDGVSTITLANSHGFANSYRVSSAALETNPIAADGDAKRLGSYGTAARSYAATLSPKTVAERAVVRATGAIGARKPATMRVPVIFDRDVAALVLGDIFTAVSAANVAIGNSFLAKRAGERIGSDLVTIVDDGRLADALGTSPFDAEGVPTQRTVVFENGTLRSFLYDSYYARRLGARSTGNSAGSAIGPNNFFLERGRQSVESIVASTARGVLITNTIGFATESVTGTYSRGARGFAIENGEIAYPIDEFTIACNLADLLGSIDAVADDLIFDQGIVSPTFRVSEMTVSGT